MSWIPVASQTARTAWPAMIPVPAPAGTNSTLAAPYCPQTWCGMLPSTSGTSIRLRLACLVAFWTLGRHFVGFPVSPADLAVAVADDDHRGKAEPATAFDDGGAAFDFDDAVEHAVAGAFLVLDCAVCVRRAGRLVGRHRSRYWIVLRY